MKFSKFDTTRFVNQRKHLFSLIDKELEIDSHHKSYEGAIDIVFSNRFCYDEADPEIIINLHCYVAPITGRSSCFESQNDFDIFLKEWEMNLNENNHRDL